MNRRVFQLFVVFVVLFAALLINLNYVQVVQSEKLANDPRNARKLYEGYAKERGPIVTADGAVLARSVESNDQLIWRREYPQGELFAHITGYLSFSHGMTGLERTYQDVLLGTDPEVALRPENIVDYLARGPRGATVEVAITERAQRAAASALGGRAGAIVAMDPRTGAILAMYANPTFDPNPIASHDPAVSDPAYDTAISPSRGKPAVSQAFQERVAPGSTFKVVTAATALMNGLGPGTAYPDPAFLDLPDTNATLANFTRGRPCVDGRQTTMEQALPVSCNTYFAQLGLSLGSERMRNEAELFGFNKPFPELGLENAPSVFPPQQAFAGNKPAVAFAAIGQYDVAATPLQMAAVAAAVGNQGQLKQPHVVSKIKDAKGRVVRDNERNGGTELSRPMDQPRANQLRDMMVEAVEKGTGRSARIPGVKVAGKTGTTNNFEQAWFMAFAPAENPTVAVAVLIQNDGNEATGGQVAAPAGKQVMQVILGQQSGN
ncbi:MAG: cell division protein FtsI [Acidobacteria bacterium]|nr:MAG: cell division protein FtsI [Acidobacteriota bacterium]